MMGKVPLRRWCLTRLRRACLFLSFIGMLTLLVIAAFQAVNSSNITSYMSASRSAISSASDVISIADDGTIRQARPIVQFYPDNQSKLFYRKASRDSERPAELESPPAARRTGRRQSSSERARIESLKDRVLSTEKRRNRGVQRPGALSNSDVSTDVHIFYYGWYTNPEIDGQYSHWNHQYIPPWDKRDKRLYPTGSHDPTKGDIGSNFFPELGAYSSRDPKVIDAHMKQMKKAGVGVIVFSWYPPGLADENGKPSDELVPVLLDAAEKEGLKLALHVEPYQNLTVDNFKAHLQYVKEQYWDHPAFYKKKVGFRELPVFYIYDSYRVLPQQWARLLSTQGDISIRGTNLDALFIGLLVEYKHKVDIKKGKFDGFYTYFAANGFSYGSSWKNWKGLQDYAVKNSLMFIPSIGPGYVDTCIRPWNGATTRDRRGGEYYALGWRTALSFVPKMVSITSFNEWHEGSQIETAVPRPDINEGRHYLSYAPEESDFYLTETKRYVEQFVNATVKLRPKKKF